MKEIKRLIIPIIFLVLVLLIVSLNFDKNKIDNEYSTLVIFGDNITKSNSKYEYKPFVKDGGVYVAVETIKNTIDSDIYYDKVATKVIITTPTDVVKLKIDESKISRNFEYSDISTPALIVNENPYIDLNLVSDIYNIKIDYDEKNNTIVIDKLENDIAKVKYARVKVYGDIKTNSNILDTLNKDDNVIVYTSSLNHNRWYKIKTQDNVIGFISKNNIEEIQEKSNENNINNEKENKNNKITMFWQQGNDLEVLGKSKIDGVNVVSPSWYELKTSSGEISSKYSSSYYNRAKEYGYEIWPMINNGFGSGTGFSTTTTSMLNSEYNRENFIKNLVKILKEDKVSGINFDFESMKEEDRDLYSQLIKELAPFLKKENIKLSADIYFVNYIDRKAVGKAVDYLVLMGYDQRGDWSSEAGSIAEISWVENNIDSLINHSKVPASKIILGVPFYTRLWTEKNGKLSTKIYNMKQCSTFISNNELTPVWDEDAGQNYAETTVGSIKYKLWLEDELSIKRRVETVNKYSLAGVSGWKKGLETENVWKIIKENMK